MTPGARVDLPPTSPGADAVHAMAARGVRLDVPAWCEAGRRAREAFRAAGDVERWRSLGAYLDTSATQARRTGRVRAAWHELRCGRLTATRPPLQSVTKAHGLRQAVIPADGCVFVVADWRSAHAWIAAGLSGDVGLIDDLTSGDVYLEAGAGDRKVGKIRVLSTLNGAGDDTVGADVGAWWARYPALDRYVKATRAEPRWTTPLGRRLDLTGEVDVYTRAPAWLWTSHEADAMRMVLRSVEGAVLVVHDEIVLEVAGDGLAEAAQLRDRMAWALRFVARVGASDDHLVSVDVRGSWGR